ncbi:MAG: hypothetical protein ACXVB9_12700 [Bdellovibrionota bacterium]
MFPRALLLCSLLFACSTFAYRSPGAYDGGPLLGPGTYLAEAMVELKDGTSQRINAVFSRKALGGFSLFSAIAPSGKPLFRARDSLKSTEAPLMEYFPTEVTLPRAELAAFYDGLRPLLLLNDHPAAPMPLVKARYPDGRPSLLSFREGLELHIGEYDWDGHAFRLTLNTPGWAAKITLRQYEISQ